MSPIITTITSNGQVYFPDSIRKALKLTKSGRIKISLNKGKAVIEPVKSSILDAAGMFAGSKPIKPVNIDKIRDHIDYSQW